MDYRRGNAGLPPRKKMRAGTQLKPLPDYFCRMLLYFFPLLAALIGWIFNSLLLRYLFRNALPARAPQLAALAGQYASEQLLAPGQLGATLRDPQQLAGLKPLIEAHLDAFLHGKLKEKMPAIAMFIGEKTIDTIKKSLMEEIDLLLPALLEKYAGDLAGRLDISSLLAAKVRALPEGRIEALLHRHLGREKRLFGLYGALCGLVTGIVLALLACCCR